MRHACKSARRGQWPISPWQLLRGHGLCTSGVHCSTAGLHQLSNACAMLPPSVLHHGLGTIAVLPAHLTLLRSIVMLQIDCGLQVAHLQLMQQEAAAAHMEQVTGLQQQVELEGRHRWEEAEARALAQQRLEVGSTHAVCRKHALPLKLAHRS